jgi:thioredoxin-like negative regulator of GroEL
MKIEALYFTSPNCCVCDVLEPKLKQLIHDNYRDIIWQYIDSSKRPSFAASHSVFVSPVLILKIDGKEQFRFVRNFSLFQVEEKLNRLYSLMNPG